MCDAVNVRELDCHGGAVNCPGFNRGDQAVRLFTEHRDP